VALTVKPVKHWLQGIIAAVVNLDMKVMKEISTKPGARLRFAAFEINILKPVPTVTIIRNAD